MESFSRLNPGPVTLSWFPTWWKGYFVLPPRHSSRASDWKGAENRSGSLIRDVRVTASDLTCCAKILALKLFSHISSSPMLTGFFFSPWKFPSFPSQLLRLIWVRLSISVSNRGARTLTVLILAPPLKSILSIDATGTRAFRNTASAVIALLRNSRCTNGCPMILLAKKQMTLVS